MPKKSSRAPLSDLAQKDHLSEATAQEQLADGMSKALLAADKAKKHVRSAYGRRVLSMCRTDIVRLGKLVIAWEKELSSIL